jgi:hypothetical protein
MGLAVEVGMLADLKEHDEEGAQWLRDALADINAVFGEHKLPLHIEPEQLPPMNDRSIIGSFPYSFLHYLRRAYARWKQDPGSPIVPCSPDEDPASDPAIDQESCMFDSHLLCHSDCEGFYVPIRFSKVLIDDTNQDRIAGGLLGSSYKLMEELQSMAEYLAIQVDAGELSDAEAEKIRADVQAECDLWIERGVWLTLFEAARLSIQHKTAICFG